MFDDLAGKCVVVTGGVTGIGGAASLAFRAAGAKIMAQYLSGGGALDSIAGQGIETQCLDLTSQGAADVLVDEALRRLGRIDVLVNNAGGMVERRLLAEQDDALFDRVIDLNVRQLVACCRAVVPVFRRQGGGTIINVSSIAARAGGGPGSSLYAGAKSFVSAFSKSIAKELVGDNIRVNCISPGTIHTAFHDRHSDAARREAMRQTIPMLRLGDAEDCAGTFLYLASGKASGYVTGQVIEVNGGQLMP